MLLNINHCMRGDPGPSLTYITVSNILSYCTLIGICLDLTTLVTAMIIRELITITLVSGGSIGYCGLHTV